MSDAPDEWDVPPMVRCSRCGRVDCAGCAPAVDAPAHLPELPWEGPGASWLARLYRTAELSALVPEQVFGRLTAGPLGPALGFALVCETLAVGSLLFPLVLLGVWLSPELFSAWLSGVLFFGLLVLGLLVTWWVHWLWGFCLELGAGWGGAHPDHGRGFRFGMYSTGWDLLTSPAGLALALWFRGPRGCLRPLVSATRVPRRAVDTYLDDCRGLSPRARRAAWAVTVGAFSLAFGVLLLGAVVGTYLWVQSRL